MSKKERRIVDGILDSKEPALADMIERHGGKVLAILRRRFPGQDGIEDAFNRAALQIWTDLHKYDRDGKHNDESLGALLLLIADHRMIDLIRKSRRAEARNLTDAELSNLALTSPETKTNSRSTMLVQDLYTILDDLSPLERAVIRNELSKTPMPMKELAKEVGTTLGTMYNAKHRAIKKVKKALLELGYFSD